MTETESPSSRLLYNTNATAATALLLMAVAAPPLFAWGNEGHIIVCEIAFQRLSPEGRSLLNEVRALDSEIQDPFNDCQSCNPGHPSDARPMSFDDACTWPDESRRDTFKDTYEYHFINMPRSAAGFDLLRDCGNLDCALAGIQRFAQYLARPASPTSSREKERRALAIRFLAHFVGDLHQPLHVGFVEDLGGNLINVRWKEGTLAKTGNLHSVWDSTILHLAGLSTLQDARTLEHEITPQEAAQWRNLDIVAWAAESDVLSRQHAYRKPDGTPVHENDLLDTAYLDAAEKDVRVQVKKAGVRLAALVDAAAKGTLPANLVRVTP